jgi:replicative DNA helicase
LLSILNAAQPPHNPEAERSLLGAILLNPSVLDRVKVQPVEFFLDRHRVIYSCMLAMKATEQVIDLVTVKDELVRLNKMGEAGGAAYVAALVDGIPDIANAEHYAKIIHEDAALRNLMAIGHGIVNAAHAALDSAGEIASRSALRLSELAITEDDGPQPISVIGDRTVHALEDRSTRDGNFITGIRTTLDAIDGYSLGLQRGALSIFGGRARVAKTTVANEIALACARRGERVLFLELDMPEQMHGQRLLCNLSGVDSFKIRTGNGLSPNDWKAIVNAHVTMRTMGDSLVIDTARDLATITATINKLARSGGLDLIIVDHIGHVEGGAGDMRYVQLGNVASRLIAAADKHNAALLVLSQLKREAEEREPVLTDLRESGNLDGDARLVVMWDRPFLRGGKNPNGDPYASCDLRLHVEKNEGETSPWLSVHLDEKLQRVTSTPERNCGAAGCAYKPPTFSETRLW